MTLSTTIVPDGYRSSHAVAIEALCAEIVRLAEGPGLHASTLVNLAQFCATEPVTRALVEGLLLVEEGEDSGSPESPWLVEDCRQLAPEVVRARVSLWIMGSRFDGEGRKIIERAAADLDAVMEPLGEVFDFVAWPFWEVVAASGVPLDAGSSWWADAYHRARSYREEASSGSSN
jgi:hypothetical protein